MKSLFLLHDCWLHHPPSPQDVPAEAELDSWRALPLFSGPMEVAAAARAAATAPAGLESGQVAREGTALAAEPFPLATIVRHFKGDCPLSFLPMHMPLIPALTCLSCSMGQ